MWTLTVCPAGHRSRSGGTHCVQLISVTFAAGKHCCVCHLCLPSGLPVSTGQSHIGRRRQWYQTHSCERVHRGKKEVCFWQQRTSSWTVKVLTWNSFPEGWSSYGGFVWAFSTLLWKRGSEDTGRHRMVHLHCVRYTYPGWMRICGEGHYHVWRVFVLCVLSHCTALFQAVFFGFFVFFYMVCICFHLVATEWRGRERASGSLFSLVISRPNSCTVNLKGLCVW